MKVADARAIARTQNRRERLNVLGASALLWGLAAVFALTGLTLQVAHSKAQRGAPVPASTGQWATVLSCDEVGPISLQGFGFHTVCHVRVEKGFSTFGRQLRADEASLDDVGKTFPVRSTDGKNSGTSRYEMADAGFFGTLAMIGAVLMIICLLLLLPVYRLAFFSRTVMLLLDKSAVVEQLTWATTDGRLMASPWRPGSTPPKGQAPPLDRIARSASGYLGVNRKGIFFRNTKKRFRLPFTKKLLPVDPKRVWYVQWPELAQVRIVGLHRSNKPTEPPVIRLLEFQLTPERMAEDNTALARHWNAMGASGAYRLDVPLGELEANTLFRAIKAHAPQLTGRA